MLCNSRACDVLRGRREGKGEGEDEGEKNGRRRVCYGRKVGYPGLPFPDTPIAVMVSSVPSGPPVQKVWDCANHDKQSLSLRGRCSTDSRVTRHRQITIHGCCGVEEGTSWRGEGGQGGFPDPSSGVTGVPNVPTNNGTPSLDPAPPCAHLSFPIRTSLPSLFHHHQNTTTPGRHHRTNCSQRTTVLAGLPRLLLKPPGIFHEAASRLHPISSSTRLGKPARTTQLSQNERGDRWLQKTTFCIGSKPVGL